MKILQTWKQESWNPQLDVTLFEGAIIAVAGVPVNTERETALANIILRMNGSTIVKEQDNKKLMEIIEELKNETKTS